jgi:hypothetical protein
MTKKKFGVGLLVMALIFGMMVIGCDTKGGGSGPSSTTSEGKSITITEITGQSGIVVILLYSSAQNISKQIVAASGEGTVSNNSVTFNLYEGITESKRWTGSGDYIIALAFDKSEDIFMYTNGKPIMDIIDDPPKCKISSTKTTVKFNLFKEMKAD